MAKSLMPTPERMRKRFAELSDQIASIHAVSDPMRDARDQHVSDAREIEHKMNADIRNAEDGLFDLKQEQAVIMRALGGRTAEPEVPAETAEA